MSSIYAMHKHENLSTFSKISATISNFFSEFSLPSLFSLNPFSKYTFINPKGSIYQRREQKRKNIITIASIITSLVYLQRQKANAALLNIIKKPSKHMSYNDLKQKDWREIQKCVQLGADPDLRIEPSKRSLINIAISCKQEKFVDYLLRRGINIDTYNRNLLSVLLSFSGSTWKGDFRFLDLSGKGLNKTEIRILENLLQNNADPNAGKEIRNTPLYYAITYNNDSKATKLLIKYGADIDKKDLYGNTLLTTILNRYLTDIEGITNRSKTIKITEHLLHEKPSLLNINNDGDTIFHVMVSKHLPKEAFETVLIHACPKDNVNITKTMREALLVFSRNNLPHEVQILILSKLLSDDYFHYGLCDELLKLNFAPSEFYLRAHIKNRTIWLDKIIQHPNKKGETALQLFNRLDNFNYYLYQNELNELKEIESFLDRSRLRKDYKIFMENSKILNSKLSERNLACGYKSTYEDFNKLD